MDFDEILLQYPVISPAQLHAAFVYYFDHRAEIESLLREAEAQRLGLPDEAQLCFAAAQDRCLFSFNRGDFADLHQQILDRGEHHAGIVVCRQATVGPVVRALSALLSTHSAEQLRDRLI